MFLRQWFTALLFAGIALPRASAQQTILVKPLPETPDFSKEAYVAEHLSNVLTEENDGTGIRETKAEIKMLAEAGVKAFAVLGFIYTSANEAVEIDYVRVRKPDGTIVKTPDYNIQDMPGEVTREAPLYSDIHEKHVAVKGLGVGDVLEYLVRYRVFKPEVPGHFWYEHSFATGMISRDERLEIRVPSGKYVKIVSPEFKAEISEEGGRKIYRWTHANLSVKEKKPGEIPRRFPPNPDVQVTTFADWEGVGRWYGELQKEPVQVTQGIQAKAAELTKGLKTNDEKSHAIYKFVALKFHYIGLDFGIGRYQPHAADDVLDNGYGDCKDKHTLLASLLKAAGIEAWPVLIHASRQLDPDVPSPAQFNHVITIVPQGDHFIWLDTTAEVFPYGFLARYLRDKQALVIPVNQAPMLMKTPANPPYPQRQEFSMQGKLSSDGTFTGHAEITDEGDVAAQMRAVFRAVSESQWKETMQRISYSLSFAGDVSNVKISPTDEIDSPFTVSYDYERKNFGDWENHRTISALPPMGIEFTNASKDMKPEEPFPLGALGKVTYRYRVRLPEGYKPELSGSVHLTEPYADYDSLSVFEDGELTITRQFLIKKTEVALSEWDGFRQLGKAVNDDEYNFISLKGPASDSAGKESKNAGKTDPSATSNGSANDLFEQGTHALQQGDFQRAEALFEKVIAKDPNHRGAHFNLGIALARKNVSGAMDEFRKEEKVSPDDPRPYQAVAAYLTARGAKEGAVEEWRKLLKVEPGNQTATSALAALLFESGKYGEVVTVLESALKLAPDSYNFQLQLGNAYIKTGQGDKAVAQFKDAVSKNGNDPMMLNDVAYTLTENKIDLDLARQYAEKAVEDLDAEAQGSESSNDAELKLTFDLSHAWDTLGWVYFRQGDAKRAEMFVRAAWLLGEDSVVGEHLGEVYESEGKTQQAARAYELALTVSSLPPTTFGTGIEMAKMYQGRSNEIRARYKKLTGKDPPLTEIKRLPNGEWSKTPAQQLLQTREIKLTNADKLSGSAEFLVTFKPGSVSSVEYFDGNNELERLKEELKVAHYPLEFPPDSGAVLMMRIGVRCQPSAPCTAALVNPVASSMQLALPPN